MRISLHQQPRPPRVTTGTEASRFTLGIVGNEENFQLMLHDGEMQIS